MESPSYFSLLPLHLSNRHFLPSRALAVVQSNRFTIMDASHNSKPASNGLHSVESQQSKPSQTAADFIDEQLALEADAREVLPYKFDKCTSVLGPLRQEIYACLTCSPPPASAAQQYTPAGVCYACSISCHGEHNLVELFNRRNFVCDCGTTRFANNAPCTLRSDSATGARGTHSQEPAKTNTYNQNFQNKFCACGDEYDADNEKGTMFQCIGLGSVESGGCGEDWYHPECLMGLPKDWYLKKGDDSKETSTPDAAEGEEKEHPAPPGFPNEDDFEALVCYKCVEANPWIKPYAGTEGFLPPVFHDPESSSQPGQSTEPAQVEAPKPSLKRKASDEGDDTTVRPASPTKRLKEEQLTNGTSPSITAASDNKPTQPTPTDTITLPEPSHKHTRLPLAPSGRFSLLLTSNFRDSLCHCPACFPHLIPYPHLLDEESTYEPSLSSASASHPAHEHNSSARSAGSQRSLLDRGEAALNNMDRVKAIEGVMVYNHLRDKVKEFLRPYAESGKVVSAEDIKGYFEGLRGDTEGIRAAGEKRGAASGEDGKGGDGEADGRREQSGY